MNVEEILAPPKDVEWQDETDPAVRAGWQIDNLGSLQWALERMGDLEAEAQENDALKLQAVARIEGRVAQLNANAKRGVEFFRSCIHQYMAHHRQELLKGGKKKSRDLPSGRIGWRTKGGKLKVTDDAAALEWARAQPIESEFTRIKVELSRTALQEHFKRTGEIPPGCDFEPEYDEAFVDPIIPETSLAVKE